MDNNPLKQYFRRPAVYLKLPSKGIGYPEGTIDMPPTGELPVFPMTAIDEITSRTPDALFNGTAIVELIKSCVPNIKDPWHVLSCDLDAILLAIKAAGGGDGLTIDSKCPNCGESNSYSYNIGAALGTIKTGDYETVLEIKELKIKFRPVNYKEMTKAGIEQTNVQKALMSLENVTDQEKRNDIEKSIIMQITETTFDVVSKSIEYIEVPNLRVQETQYIVDFLKNCEKATYDTIKEYSMKLKSESDLKPMDLKCSNCSFEYKQTLNLNFSDFFG